MEKIGSVAISVADRGTGSMQRTLSSTSLDDATLAQLSLKVRRAATCALARSDRTLRSCASPRAVACMCKGCDTWRCTIRTT
jgi:hypothetical protein